MDDDSIKDPLLSKYLVPQCSALSMLADVATELDGQETSSYVPCISFCFTPMKPMNNGAAADDDDEVEALGSYDFLKPETSNKPIKFMASAFEASPSLKLHMYRNKAVKNNANEILKEDSFPKEEEASKKPINLMGFAVEEGATSENFKEEDLPLKKRKRSALNLTQDAAFINDDDAENVDVLDQEWVMCESSNKKGKSLASSSNKRQRIKEAIDAAPTELPQEFKDKINEMAGTEITFLITKSLFKSDLNSQENRLLMPSNQIKNPGFLREEELQKLGEKEGIPVTLIQPSLELTNLTLVKWDMGKKKGTATSNYVLRSCWKEVVDSNELKEGDVVQVWSFRVQEELHMALVKL